MTVIPAGMVTDGIPENASARSVAAVIEWVLVDAAM